MIESTGGHEVNPSELNGATISARGHVSTSGTHGLLRPIPKAVTPEEIEAALAEIASERPSRRQLRRAVQIAEVHGIESTSELDAIRLLREAGINPFSLASMVRRASTNGNSDLSATNAAAMRASGRDLVRLPRDNIRLSKRSKGIESQSAQQHVEVNQAAEVLRMQTEIALRRRRQLVLLFVRLFAFVLLPSLVAGWYFYMAATPIYSVRSEFIILKAGPSSSGDFVRGLFSGAGLAKSQDSIAVEGYLNSLEAMERLDRDRGFSSHFQNPNIDPIQRLASDASLEESYRFYKKFVSVEFDERDQLIRMEVMATDPKVAAEWSRQLIEYAEGQIDHLTRRLRDDQMRDAQAGFDEAQGALRTAQRELIGLQQKFKTISSETEVALIFGEIGRLENQITQEQLSLSQMEANSEPNEARTEPIKRRISSLQGEVGTLRARMTESASDTESLAEIQGELQVAQASIRTRQMLLAKALQSLETSRIEANQQVRYLSMVVNPTQPDEPTYPRAFEDTLVTMLILLVIYAVASMGAAIWREQVTS